MVGNSASKPLKRANELPYITIASGELHRQSTMHSRDTQRLIYISK